MVNVAVAQIPGHSRGTRFYSRGTCPGCPPHPWRRHCGSCMPISCHFRDCKAVLVMSLTHVSGAIASVHADLYTFTFYTHACRTFRSSPLSFPGAKSSWKFQGTTISATRKINIGHKHIGHKIYGEFIWRRRVDILLCFV